MDNKAQKILVLGKEEELGKSIKRYFKYFHKQAGVEINNDLSLKSVIQKTKELQSESLIIIVDFYDDENNKWGGLPLLKRLKTFWFPYYIPTSETDKKKNFSTQDVCKIHIIPVLFLCADAIWQLEVAMLRAEAFTEFGENECFVHHLNLTKATFFLKIPFQIDSLSEISSLALKCNFVSDLSRIKLLSAAMGYEEHHGH